MVNTRKVRWWYAFKYKLDNLTVLVDRNHLQICGCTEDIMPQSIRELYKAMDWNVRYLPDGHDYNSLFTTLADA